MNKRHPPRHAVSVTTFCLTALAFWPAVGQAEDLLQAYQQAVATSPVLAQAKAQLQADLAGRPLARSALLPHLGLAASVGENTANITGFGTPISTGYHSESYSATLTQSIFDGQAYTAIKQANSRIRAGEAFLVTTEQNLILQVTQAYFGVLRAQAEERVAQRQRDLLESIYKQTEAFLEVGTGDIIAVREAQARLDAATADLIRAQNAVLKAFRTLERLTHQPVGVLRDLGPITPEGPHPDKMEPWVETAIKNQPLLHQAEAQLRTAQEQVEYNQRAYWPTLDLQGIAQHTRGAPFPGVVMDQIGATINFSMPIYQGGQISSSISQAQAQAQASLQSLINQQDQTKLNTETSFLNLESSVPQLEAAKEAVISAKTSLDGTRKGYEVGTRSIIDVLNTATDYATAQRNYFLALYNQVLARVELKAAAGVLGPLDVEAVNGLLTEQGGKEPLP